MKPCARYSITTGLHGLYMPDSYIGPFEVNTRKELMAEIRYALEFAEFPKSCIREVKATRLWGFIKRHGSSQAHFNIVHKGREIAFHGLTQEEYQQSVADAEVI